MFNSIPNLITKSKNIFENKSTNQIDLFGDISNESENLIPLVKDWEFEERLAREFEAVGFFISDHPLNQFKDIFSDYNVINYQDFNSDEEKNETNIAATLLKIQERKTSKGNSYAVLKLTDLTSVFELFIFSDVLESNREILKEGSSLILTLKKSISSEENRFKRINVLKIATLKNLLNTPIKEATFNLDSLSQLEEITKYLNNPGGTFININIKNNDKILNFKLENKRNLDRKTLNLIRNKQISAIIN